MLRNDSKSHFTTTSLLLCYSEKCEPVCCGLVNARRKYRYYLFSGLRCRFSILIGVPIKNVRFRNMVHLENPFSEESKLLLSEIQCSKCRQAFLNWQNYRLDLGLCTLCSKVRVRTVVSMSRMSENGYLRAAFDVGKAQWWNFTYSKSIADYYGHNHQFCLWNSISRIFRHLRELLLHAEAATVGFQKRDAKNALGGNGSVSEILFVSKRCVALVHNSKQHPFLGSSTTELYTRFLTSISIIARADLSQLKMPLQLHKIEPNSDKIQHPSSKQSYK